MVNPFDNVINVGNEHKEHVEEIKVPEKENKKEAHTVNISFTFDKKMLERGIYGLIIIILLTLIFINPFCSKCNEGIQDSAGNAALTGAAVVEEEEKEAEITVSSKADEINAAKEEEKIKEEEAAVVEEEEVEKPFKTNFDFIIDDIDYYKCEDINDDCENDDKPVKIKSISFTMRNRWKDFKPRVEVYWYDDDSSEAIKEKKRMIKIYKEIEKGSTVRYTIKKFDSTFFDPQNNEETIELKLYNRENGLLMDTEEEIIR